MKFNLIKPYIKLPRNIYALFFAHLVNSAGSFVYPFLAMFLTLKLGYSGYFAGIMLTIIIMAESLGKLVGGKLADIFGRKIIIILLSLISAGFYFAIAFMDNHIIIIYMIIAAGFIKSGAFPAINALIIDSTTRRKRNDAFSLIYLGQNLGYAVGPLTAGFLFMNHINLIFLIDAITTVFALIPIIVLVKESLFVKRGIYLIKKHMPINERPEYGNVLKIFFKKPVLYGYAFISIIFSLIYVQSNFSLPIYLENLFDDAGPRFYGSLMAINAVVVIIMTVFIVAAIKKYNPIINISISGLLFAVGFGMIFFSRFYGLFIVSTIVWTIGEIISSVSSNVLVANYSPITHRARFSAIISFISGAGFAVGPLLAGVFIKYLGIKNMWPFIFYLSLFAAVLMVMLFFVEKIQSRKTP
jgi:MFS family permease